MNFSLLTFHIHQLILNLFINNLNNKLLKHEKQNKTKLYVVISINKRKINICEID